MLCTAIVPATRVKFRVKQSQRKMQSHLPTHSHTHSYKSSKWLKELSVPKIVIVFPLWLLQKGAGAETGAIVSHQWFVADDGQGPLKRTVFQDQTHQVTRKPWGQRSSCQWGILLPILRLSLCQTCMVLFLQWRDVMVPRCPCMLRPKQGAFPPSREPLKCHLAFSHLL